MVCSLTIAHAQHEPTNENHDSHTGGHHRHQIQFLVGHTHISEGLDSDDDKKWLALASWGLNYNFHIDQKWSVGVHSDVILEDFRVRQDHRNDMSIERRNPIAVAVMGGYRFWGPFAAMLGGGMEFETEENLGFVRIGLEPSWLFGGGKWEVSAVGTYELKIDAYNSWAFGFAISRLF